MNAESIEVRSFERGVAEPLDVLLTECAGESPHLHTVSQDAAKLYAASQAEDADLLGVARSNGEDCGVVALWLPEGEKHALVRFLGVKPRQRGMGVGNILESYAARTALGKGRAFLKTGFAVNSLNRAGSSFLSGLGWKPVGDSGIRMRRSLEDLPAVDLPQGYTIRAYKDGDAEHFVRVKNAAFAEVGGTEWTLDDFREEYLDSPHFSPERVLFAVADRTPVGTTTAWEADHKDRQVGLIHWVAVSPEHRGGGLGRALNIVALHKLKELGHNEAILNTSEAHAAAVRLYYRLGFQDAWRSTVYQKQLTSSVERGKPVGGG